MLIIKLTCKAPALFSINFANLKLTPVNTGPKKTTLLLIPGGADLALPQNSAKFKSALELSITNKTAQVIMLADEAIVPEETVQASRKYKNVLLIESDQIITEDDALNAAKILLTGHLPVLSQSGFDYQVVKMEFVDVKYEDFERLAKFI